MALNPTRQRDWDDAERAYAEQYGSLVSAVAFHRLWSTGQFVANLIMAAALVHAAHEIANLRPLVLTEDRLGQVVPYKYEQLEWAPNEREIKYFLTQFATSYYGRNKETIRNDYRRAAAFLAPDKEEECRQAWTVGKVLEGTADREGNIDVDVKLIAIDPMRYPPYKAQVDYQEVARDKSGAEMSRTSYRATIVFRFRRIVPSEALITNPIGLEITQFREDSAFKDDAPHAATGGAR